MKWISTLSIVLIFCASVAGAESSKRIIASQNNSANLQESIAAILRRHNVPGVAVSLVGKDGQLLTFAVGTSNVETGQLLTSTTLLRIGSISKMFVAISALALQEQGKLDLDAPIRSIVPEVAFQNPWESTDPVRIVHLFEHTTGWEDLHLKDFANNDPSPLSLRQGLELTKDSRISRWKPGTRFSYCNSGPAVAAFIIQKVTNQSFESYIKRNLFDPIGMSTANYLYTPATTINSTKLYQNDGKTTYSYKNLILRPPGAINASARDMGRFLQFLLARGVVNGRKVVEPSVFGLMERVDTGYGAKAGLSTGYGKGNYTSTDNDGFTWHGHGGAMEGSLSNLAYLPHEGIGYFYSINSDNEGASDEIDKAIQAYIIKDLPKPGIPTNKDHLSPRIQNEFSGWYQFDSPRMQMTYFQERLIPIKVTLAGNTMAIDPLIGRTITLVAAGPMLFRKKYETIPTSAILSVGSDKRIILDTDSYIRLPTALALFELIIELLITLAVASVLLFTPIFLVRSVLDLQFRRSRMTAFHIFPIIAAISLLLIVLIDVVCSNERAISLLGRISPYSIALFVLTIVFSAAAPIGLIAALYQQRTSKVSGFHYWYPLVTSLLLSIVSVYFFYWGVIGLRTWK